MNFRLKRGDRFSVALASRSNRRILIKVLSTRKRDNSYALSNAGSLKYRLTEEDLFGSPTEKLFLYTNLSKLLTNNEVNTYFR